MSATIETPTGPMQPMVLNMGPQHPSTHGVLRVILELDGEIVLKAEPVIGYLHTGIEKSCESKTYSQAITLTDRIDYLAPLSNNLGYCLAVEKLIGIEVPKRAQYIRVLLTELTRIASHLVWLGTHAIDLGAMSVFLYSFREREEILKIFEYVSGQRMMTSYFRIGGLALEPPPDWLDRVRRVIDALPGHIDEYEDLLTQNRIWIGPHQGRRHPQRRRRDRHGRFRARCCAPAASPTTFARAFPYSSYDEFDFNVQTQTAGDCYARYQVRVAEMRESLKIVRQAMEKIPAEGPFRAEAAGNHSAVARGDENLDRRPDLPLQDFHRGLRAAAGRGLSGDRIAARRIGRVHGERRLAEAVPREVPHAVVRESAVVAEAVRRPSDRRCGRLHRHDRHRSGRSGPLLATENEPCNFRRSWKQNSTNLSGATRSSARR